MFGYACAGKGRPLDGLVQEVNLRLLVRELSCIAFVRREQTLPESCNPDDFHDDVVQEAEGWLLEVLFAKLRLCDEGAERLLGFLDPRRSDLYSQELSAFWPFSFKTMFQSFPFNSSGGPRRRTLTVVGFCPMHNLKNIAAE